MTAIFVSKKWGAVQSLEHAKDREKNYKELVEKEKVYAVEKQALNELLKEQANLSLEIENLERKAKTLKDAEEISLKRKTQSEFELIVNKQRGLTNNLENYIESLKPVIYDAEYQEKVSIINQCKEEIAFYTEELKLAEKRLKEKEDELNGKFNSKTITSAEKSLAELAKGSVWGNLTEDFTVVKK